MDLSKNGKLLRDLRSAKGMTQKQVADQLNICAKTVSKWETGHGFPDVSTVTALAEILGVSSDTILSGNLVQNLEEVGNMKKTQFYVCPHCSAMMQGTGECQVVCCGKQLEPLKAVPAEDTHALNIAEVENDYYITFRHEMTKAHFIRFVAYVTFDQVLVARLYPEQDASVRFPKMGGGTFYCCCNQHGLFVHHPQQKKTNRSDMQASRTALMSAFARAYHAENSDSPIFNDYIAKKFFSDDEYAMLQKYIADGSVFLQCNGEKEVVKAAVNTQFAPAPLARARFCEESLETAVRTGTSQYVMLGSGLDTFAFRNDNPSIRIFELDKKAMIDDKIRRCNRAKLEIPSNTVLIGADLSKERIGTVLEKNGFDRRQKTLFSCLGLFYYLSDDEISRMLSDIASFAAEGSAIVFDFADNHLFSSNVPRVKNMLAMANQSGEPMKSCFSYEALELLLQQHCFFIYVFLNDRDIQTRYFSDGSELTAFEHIHYALAVLKKP